MRSRTNLKTKAKKVALITEIKTKLTSYTAPTYVSTTLYSKYDKIATRKIMTFNRNTDFEFEIAYGKDADAGMKNIAKVRINGLTAAMEAHREDIKSSEQPPKVRIAFDLSDSGVLSVPEATLSIQKPTFKGNLLHYYLTCL